MLVKHYIVASMTCKLLSVAMYMYEQYKYDNRNPVKSDINIHMQQEESGSKRTSHDIAKRREYDTRITRQNSNPLVFGLSYLLRLLSLLVKSV